MRYKMKKSIVCLGALLLASFLLQAYAQAQPDEKLFQDAKILIFDKEWKKAQEKLEELIEEYPDSAWVSQAVFYRAKCLKEQGDRDLEALKAYQDFIKRKDRSRSLTEDAETEIIDLAFELYRKGRKSYISEIENRLSSPSRTVRYFAAIKLSQVKERRTASKAVPVLKEIIEKEKDDELRDRAKIALLRIDPDALKDVEEQRRETKALIVNIRVWKQGKLTLKVNIPWALFDLVLGAVSEEEKDLMEREGYDIDRMRKILMELGEPVTIEDPEEGLVIKIWIE